MKRFSDGDRVKVLALGKTGHVRIPHYVRNRAGRILEYCGTYLNPEDLAVGNTAGKAVDLYRVVFTQSDLWPEAEQVPGDELVIEIYDHWLSPLENHQHGV